MSATLTMSPLPTYPLSVLPKWCPPTYPSMGAYPQDALLSATFWWPPFTVCFPMGFLLFRCATFIRPLSVFLRLLLFLFSSLSAVWVLPPMALYLGR